METQRQNAGMGWGKKKEEEVNGTGLGEMNGGRGGRQRDGATEEMGEERHERVGVHGPSLWGVLLFTERGPLDVCGGLRTGVPTTAGEGGERKWGDHPAQELPPTPQGGGGSYRWRGVWGGGCQSPRLPNWSWSCHLICCVGREKNGAVSQGVGVRVGESCSLTCRPAPRPLRPPTGGVTGSSAPSGRW